MFDLLGYHFPCVSVALYYVDNDVCFFVYCFQEKKSKKSMSSKAFFTQLQEEVTTQIRAKTEKKKEKKKQISSEKFLL